jgi:O-methyltransferase
VGSLVCFSSALDSSPVLATRGFSLGVNRIVATTLKGIVRKTLQSFGVLEDPSRFDSSRFPAHIRDRSLYRGNIFQPWDGLPEFRRYYALTEGLTLVTAESCYVLWSVARQALRLGGDFMECGVYKGGSARMLAQMIADFDQANRRRLHLFDTFCGMPETQIDRDYCREGDFGDTSLKEVSARFAPNAPVAFHAGFVPQTFNGLEDLRFSFIHCDLDIYQSVLDCARFTYPRLLTGGAMVFDDYGYMTCTGARDAVDEFFADKPEFPLVFSSGQAVIWKLPLN